MALRKLVIRAIEKELEEYAQKIEDLQREEVHVKTGALRDSITTEKKGKGHYLVGIDVTKLVNDNRNIGHIDYSRAYYFGSRPHIIRAKKPGGKLAFIGNDGLWHFPTFVRHPGYKGDRFIERALARRPKL